jgi:hypothetical protein
LTASDHLGQHIVLDDLAHFFFLNC